MLKMSHRPPGPGIQGLCHAAAQSSRPVAVAETTTAPAFRQPITARDIARGHIDRDRGAGQVTAPSRHLPGRHGRMADAGHRDGGRQPGPDGCADSPLTRGMVGRHRFTGRFLSRRRLGVGGASGASAGPAASHPAGRRLGLRTSPALHGGCSRLALGRQGLRTGSATVESRGRNGGRAGDSLPVTRRSPTSLLGRCQMAGPAAPRGVALRPAATCGTELLSGRTGGKLRGSGVRR